MNANYFDDTGTFEVRADDIQAVVAELRDVQKLTLKLITATDERQQNGCFKIWYVFAAAKENAFVIPFIRLTSELQFPSINADVF